MHIPEQKEQPTCKLQLRIDIILTVLFLATIFVFGVMTVAQDTNAFHNAFGGRTRLAEYLPDRKNYTAWDLTAARIESLDDYIASNCWLSSELGEFNSTLQYGIGKRLIESGGQQMLRLNTGHLYDLTPYVSMDKANEDILSIQSICGDTPYFYVYIHPTLYDEEAQMPEEYACMDYSKEMADEITGMLQDEGVPYLDSRLILTASGLNLSDYLMVTDQHWATRAAIVMTKSVAEQISEMTGIELDTSRVELDQFETKTYEKLFLGKYGQRIGVSNVDPDDITIFWPKYETNIHRTTLNSKNTEDVSGSFYDSVIRWKYLEPDEGKTWNIKAYFDYGLTENYDIYENPDGADITVLLLKDSYSSAIGSFLSLMCKNVISYDLRKGTTTLQELLETYKPDCVVQAYSLQMLKQDKYEFQ